MESFKDLGLSEPLLQAIAALGFETPTPVQQLVIPDALNKGGDFTALAQTGTGKTAAFGLPLLQLLDTTKPKAVQALILCPTRELCVQVASDLVKYAQFVKLGKVVAVYGGSSIENQISQIRAGVQIVVATPGRLVDLLIRNVIDLSTVKRVVLDEADEMLDMGFSEPLNMILGAATNRESIWLFSATMSGEIRNIAKTYMTNPRELSTGRNNQTNENIEHHYYVCHSDDRYAALKRIVDYYPGIYGLIFCRTKADTKEVAEQMIRDGYNSDALHGDLAQAERDRAMNRFREGNLQLLIATDVAARGLDVRNISHVINYGIPDDSEVYTHRSGRTARAGKTGISISLVTPKQEERIRMFERHTKSTFIKKSIPTGPQICERQLMQIVQNIHNQEVDQHTIEPYLPQIFEELKDLSREALITRFASLEFNRFLQYYKDAVDINIQPRGSNLRRPGVMGTADGFTRLFLNVGEMDGVNKKAFIKALTRSFNVPAAAIGQIDIKKMYLHFDIASSFTDAVRKGLSQMSLNGRNLRVDLASEREGGFDDSKPKPKRAWVDEKEWKKRDGKKKKQRF